MKLWNAITQLRVNIEQLRKSQRQEEEKRQSAEAVYEQLQQLKAPKFRTPYEAIEELWKSKPDTFIVKPSHHTLGPNT